MSDELTLKMMFTGILAAGTALWGWFGWLVILWCLSMALDYLTGTLAAIRRGDWSSDVARAGLWHKAGMILIVLAAALTDAALSLVLQSGFLPVEHSSAVTVIVLAWYTLTELGSVLENATVIAPGKVPAWLQRILRVAAGTVSDAGDKLTGEPGKEDGHDGGAARS